EASTSPAIWAIFLAIFLEISSEQAVLLEEATDLCGVPMCVHRYASPLRKRYLAARRKSRLISRKPAQAVTEQEQRRELPPKPVPSATARVKLCIPSSPSLVRSRMFRPVRNVEAAAG